MAFTKLGPIRGVRENGFNIFRKIPYVEPVERLTASEPKKPWGPSVFNATWWGDGCIGTHVLGVTESESCLNLNVWLPLGGHRDMPVVVYFHGGMNQHGSGLEPDRYGDILVQSSKHPTIFVNFDFRMGILGFYHDGTADNSGVPLNLGLRDQQQALRWLQENIPAFGGDPKRVTLLGMSFGAPNILFHMVSPASEGLFSRAALISAPADMWRRDTNRLRTDFILKGVGCKTPGGGQTSAQCLKRMSAGKIWDSDWVSEDMSRDVGAPLWWQNVGHLTAFLGTQRVSFTSISQYLGWHPIVDRETLPGEPRDLIAQGRWHKVPVLMTTVRNESLGILPTIGGLTDVFLKGVLETLMGGGGSLALARGLYKETLQKRGIRFDDFHLDHAMLTDKVWTCDQRSLARDIAATGGKAYTGVFSHEVKFDPTNNRTNKVCEQGATCHASDAHFLLPQSRGFGIIGLRGHEEEEGFAWRYLDHFLEFVSGAESPWREFTPDEEAWTFIDEKGARVEPGWRRDQCDKLDAFMGQTLPGNMQRIKHLALQRIVSTAH